MTFPSLEKKSFLFFALMEYVVLKMLRYFCLLILAELTELVHVPLFRFFFVFS